MSDATAAQDPANAGVAVPAQEPAPERRTTAVELLWDLVFVFAVTQVTTLLAHRTSWARLGEAMLVLALVWWAWSAFVWAANAQEEQSRTLRACLLAGTLLIFIVGLAVPHAFGRNSLLFATTYAAVRFLHLGVYVDASRRGNASRAAILGFAVTVAIGMALLLAGALAHGWARVVLWLLAVAIDYAGPAWLTRERLRGLQQVAVAHFAERYGAFVIICLGESIVAVGVVIGERPPHRRPGDRRHPAAADRGRDVVDVLRSHRRTGPGAAARPRRSGAGRRGRLQLHAPHHRRRDHHLRRRGQARRPQLGVGAHARPPGAWRCAAGRRST